jgi:hypothetical protein
MIQLSKEHENHFDRLLELKRYEQELSYEFSAFFSWKKSSTQGSALDGDNELQRTSTARAQYEHHDCTVEEGSSLCSYVKLC